MPENGSLGYVETQYFTFAEPPNEMMLECGRKLGPITLAYETYGELNKAKDNAILVLHALSGSAHVAGPNKEDQDPPWWDTMVGPGKALDTNKYFIICSNVIGGCKGLHWSKLNKSCDRETLCPFVSGCNDKRYGKRTEALD